MGWVSNTVDGHEIGAADAGRLHGEKIGMKPFFGDGGIHPIPEDPGSRGRGWILERGRVG